MFEPGQEQRPRTRAFDAGDLRLAGLILLVIVLVLGLAALLGLATRIFLAVSGLR